jgi:hypothetical protein
LKPEQTITMKNNILLATGILFLSGITSVLMATPVPPGPSIIPVDGGLSLLVAACVGIGAKKLYDIRKSKKA